MKRFFNPKKGKFILALFSFCFFMSSHVMAQSSNNATQLQQENKEKRLADRAQLLAERKANFQQKAHARKLVANKNRQANQAAMKKRIAARKAKAQKAENPNNLEKRNFDPATILAKSEKFKAINTKKEKIAAKKLAAQDRRAQNSGNVTPPNKPVKLQEAKDKAMQRKIEREGLIQSTRNQHGN